MKTLSILLLLNFSLSALAQEQTTAKESIKDELIKDQEQKQVQSQKAENSFATEIRKATFIPQLIDVAEGTLKKQELERHAIVMERLVQLRPYNADFSFALAKAYAMLDEKSKAFNALLMMQNVGLSYPVGDSEGFENLKKYPVFQYIEDGMLDNADTFGEGSKVFSVDKNYSGLLFENLAYDKTSESFLLASVRNGAIYKVDKSGKLSEFIKASEDQAGPWGAVDLVVDDQQDVLWVASSSMPQYNGTTAENFGNSMIVKYKLSTGELLEKIQDNSLQKPLLFSAIHLMANQDLVVLNAFNSQLLKISKGTSKLEPLLTLNSLSSIRSISSDEKAQFIYVADFEQGLFALDLTQQKIYSIGDVKKANLGGIEDVFYHEGDLIIIQSGVQPARVFRMQMSSPVTLNSIFPIEASHPMFSALSKGTLTEEGIFYFANSQWEKMDVNGTLSKDQQWEDLLVIKSPHRYKQAQQNEVQKKIKEFKKDRGIGQ